jgi:hypothetical protein
MPNVYIFPDDERLADSTPGGRNPYSPFGKLFYKKECQETNFTSGWKPRGFSAFSPLS